MLPLLLSILVPMHAKLILTCLHASRNRRCNLQAPWTLIYLVPLLLLLLPPHSCLSHSSGMRDQQEAEPDAICAVATLPADVPEGALQPAPQALPVCITTPYTHPHWTSTAIYLLNGKSSTEAAAAFFFSPRCCVLSQGHKWKITSSNVHGLNLYIGNSPCLLL